jgi:anaerobic dimethyl sulfoxide reductase subunit B (iron-sulfur subunit)
MYLEDKEIAVKCNMCIDFINEGGIPACVEACPQRILEWGDMDALKKKHPSATTDIPILPNSSQTDPSTIITPRPCALDPGFRQTTI